MWFLFFWLFSWEFLLVGGQTDSVFLVPSWKSVGLSWQRATSRPRCFLNLKAIPKTLLWIAIRNFISGFEFGPGNWFFGWWFEVDSWGVVGGVEFDQTILAAALELILVVAVVILDRGFYLPAFSVELTLFALAFEGLWLLFDLEWIFFNWALLGADERLFGFVLFLYFLLKFLVMSYAYDIFILVSCVRLLYEGIWIVSSLKNFSATSVATSTAPQTRVEVFFLKSLFWFFEMSFFVVF